MNYFLTNRLETILSFRIFKFWVRDSRRRMVTFRVNVLITVVPHEECNVIVFGLDQHLALHQSYGPLFQRRLVLRRSLEVTTA